MLDEGQKSAKISKTVTPAVKYCAECQRDLSNRTYYVWHMLKVRKIQYSFYKFINSKLHNILLGDSKWFMIMEYLDQLTPAKKQNLIFRFFLNNFPFLISISIWSDVILVTMDHMNLAQSMNCKNIN